LNAKEQYKGHDRVIRALPKLVAQGHDVVYIVIGEGDDQSRLQSLANHLGMTDRVRFLGGFAPMSLVDAYRAADLFVMPSTGEGFGIAFLEAMACGTPALGLDDDGSRDALADGALGAVVSESELPNAIAHLLAMPRPDPWELHERVHGRFGRPAFLGRVNAALEGLLQSA
jgi:phosphatidylinositol alpha-1,6-mannosyltransferase